MWIIMIVSEFYVTSINYTDAGEFYVESDLRH